MPRTRPNNELNCTRTREKIPWRVLSVAMLALFERAAFWGITAPWRMYMLWPSHSLLTRRQENYMENRLQHNKSQTPGALDLGQSTATRIYCIFYVFYYTTPLFVAVLADSLLGRFCTLIISTAVYCLGCAALTISSSTEKLNEGWGVPGLAVAMVLIGLGGGGFRVVIVPFMIDQCDQKQPAVARESNRQLVVTDYNMTVQFICSVYYW